jgi:hypothetical protein
VARCARDFGVAAGQARERLNERQRNACSWVVSGLSFFDQHDCGVGSSRLPTLGSFRCEPEHSSTFPAQADRQQRRYRKANFWGGARNVGFRRNPPNADAAARYWPRMALETSDGLASKRAEMIRRRAARWLTGGELMLQCAGAVLRTQDKVIVVAIGVRFDAVRPKTRECCNCKDRGDNEGMCGFLEPAQSATEPDRTDGNYSGP